jgi:hypothetical protein
MQNMIDLLEKTNTELRQEKAVQLMHNLPDLPVKTTKLAQLIDREQISELQKQSIELQKVISLFLICITSNQSDTNSITVFAKRSFIPHI